MSQIWVQLSSDSRVLGLRFEEPPLIDADLWEPYDFPQEHYEDFNLYRVVDGELLYDPPQSYKDGIEEAERTSAIQTVIDSMPEIVSETDAAICEMYEAQEQANAETDAALCELYEMLIALGGE